MIEYELIRSKRKTLSISVTKDAKLLVRAPLRISQQKIDDFVFQHEDWINKHLSKVKSQIEKKQNFMFLAGQHIYYMGIPHEICDDNYITKIQFNDNFLHIPAIYDFEQRKNAVTKFLRESARVIIEGRVSVYAPMLSVKPQAVTITSAKTRWGSCSGNDRLSFSYRLVSFEPAIIDYVVVHELAHIIEHNHSARFYAQIARIIPDYKQRIKALKALSKEINI